MTVNAFAIPHISTATDPIHSPADLQQRWRALMGPLGFGERLIWMAVIGTDNRFTKALTQAEIDCPPGGRGGEHSGLRDGRGDR